LHPEQKPTYRQLLHDELELLRRLGIARRSASARLPILRRTGLARLPTRSDLTTTRAIKKARGLAGPSQSAASG
jgi:hypothetical protein